ncbi:MAG: branched-chain amino acid transport system II carrier protein [Parachlamydiaceae bacterium]
MKKIFKSESLALGLAMFSMFFGAGNIIFPLAIGQFAGDKNVYAITGLILTAVMMPIAGVIAMILFHGNYRQFFGRLGHRPGLFLALIIISLLGPLGSTPRCIALAYITLKKVLPGLSIVLFSGVSCLLIFACSVRKNSLINLLGWILTPLLLTSLTAVIVMGLKGASSEQTMINSEPKTSIFFHGLKEGYNTMDLLAAFFFSSTIFQSLKVKLEEQSSLANPLKIALAASCIGAILLAAIYIGFSYLAAHHGHALISHNKEELLAAIAWKTIGSHAGTLVCLIIALACLTTAIALISSFTDFIHKEIIDEKMSYQTTLIGALLLTFLISTFEFSGISVFLSPILQICYPGLILLTFLNIGYRLRAIQPIKGPVLFALALGLYGYFFS